LNSRAIARNMVIGFGASRAHRGHRRQSADLLAGVLDSEPAARRRASCASATLNIRSSPSSMCRDFCPAPRGIWGLSSTAQNFCSPIRRRRCRSSPVITRKAFGGAYTSWRRKNIGADVITPGDAQIAVMGARPVEIISADIGDPKKSPRTREYEERFLFPLCAERGYISTTDHAQHRSRIARGSRCLRGKTVGCRQEARINLPGGDFSPLQLGGRECPSDSEGR